MAENKDNVKSEGSALPPIGASIKNALPQASGVIKGSFQLDEKGKDKLPKKDWIHWALIVIPVMLLISIVVILYAFYIKPEKSGVPSITDQTQTTSDGPPPRNATPRPKLLITDEIDKASLSAYFAGVSDKWDDSMIDKVAADSQVALDEYQNGDEEDKKILAKELFITVTNPGIADPDPAWNEFLEDLKQHLESEVGESFD